MQSIDALKQAVQQAIGSPVAKLTPLMGGCIGEVYRVDLPDNTALVAKVADGSGVTLEPEGFMLHYLKTHSSLPVPVVIHTSDILLLMEFIEGDSRFSVSAEHHAAEFLAALHTVHAEKFGFERDTLIGGLHQPNPHYDSWIEFFRDQRLFYMAGEAARVGRLPGHFLNRFEKFAARLGDWLTEPEYPTLIHGDAWTTNVLSSHDHITGFLDPAIYYAHPEIELAFITLFNTFGMGFFQRYHEMHPIAPGFFETRRDIYNLYPLLVHVRLFGGGYVASVDSILRRFGF
ncbi:MAG: fructosamine kinase family protein [Chloroflexota bacterium]